MSGSYRLRPEQVPDYPDGAPWPDLLRWCLAVMDPGDRDVGFVASLLAHCAKHGGLTEKQSAYATRTVSRVRDRWRASELQFCKAEPGPAPDRPAGPRLVLVPKDMG